MTIEWNRSNCWVPGVEQIREIRHAFWCRWHSAQDCPVETDPDWHLDNHWAETTYRAYTCIFVQAHRFRRHLAAIFAFFAFVLVLNRLQFWLNQLHFLHLPGLPHGQWDHCQTDENCKYDDAESEVRKQQLIQQRKDVDHRPHNYFLPEQAKNFH